MNRSKLPVKEPRTRYVTGNISIPLTLSPAHSFIIKKQIAVNNIERLVDGLGLDLYTEVINWEEIKDLQLAFFKSGVPHIDVPQDHAFFATMYKFASKHKIKYILTGGNYSTECVRNPLEWMYYQSDSIQLRDIYKKFGTGKLKDYPVTNILWHKVYLPYVKKIKLIRPLDFVPYNKDEAMQLLVDKFGYQKYPLELYHIDPPI